MSYIYSAQPKYHENKKWNGTKCPQDHLKDSIVFFAYACIYYPLYNMWLVYATLSFHMFHKVSQAH